jgi:hypothetical protein
MILDKTAAVARRARSHSNPENSFTSFIASARNSEALTAVTPYSLSVPSARLGGAVQQLLVHMGYNMKTDSYIHVHTYYILVQWMAWDGKRLQPRWDRVAGLDLYDHSSNNQLDNCYLDATENENLVALRPTPRC